MDHGERGSLFNENLTERGPEEKSSKLRIYLGDNSRANRASIPFPGTGCSPTYSWQTSWMFNPLLMMC